MVGREPWSGSLSHLTMVTVKKGNSFQVTCIKHLWTAGKYPECEHIQSRCECQFYALHVCIGLQHACTCVRLSTLNRWEVTLQPRISPCTSRQTPLRLPPLRQTISMITWLRSPFPTTNMSAPPLMTSPCRHCLRRQSPTWSRRRTTWRMATASALTAIMLTSTATSRTPTPNSMQTPFTTTARGTESGCPARRRATLPLPVAWALPNSGLSRPRLSAAR